MHNCNLVLGVTGSVAAKLAPKLAQALNPLVHLKIVATQPALYFFQEFQLDGIPLISEADEWPGGGQWHGLPDPKPDMGWGQGQDGYRKDQPIPHIDLGDWAHLLVIAPLTANTLTKLALGLADNLLTSLYYAWPPDKPVIFAPAMNTRMWGNPLTQQHLNAVTTPPGRFIVPPVEKQLACGTTGIGAMADIADIVQMTRDVIKNFVEPQT
jgi:phosphopantothenoylcysteine synthetase/decarboxylase